MWLIFTSRINLYFNTQVQRFTCLHGITKHARDFEVFRKQRNRVFPNKNACSVSLESKRPGVDSVREKLLVGFISRLCEMGFCRQRCAALPPLGTSDAVAWSAFGQFFAGAAWNVMLQSSCKITIINIGSFAVSQKNPSTVKIVSLQSPAARNSSGEPISIPPAWTCLGQTMLMGSEWAQLPAAVGWRGAANAVTCELQQWVPNTTLDWGQEAA